MRRNVYRYRTSQVISHKINPKLGRVWWNRRLISYRGSLEVFPDLFRRVVLHHGRGKLTGRTVYHVSPLDLILSLYNKVAVL